MENRKRIAPDQIIFAVPAALFLVTPLLDVFINFFQTITAKREWETFKIIPYLPVGILGILFLSLIFFFIRSEDKNIFRLANRRTMTFQTTLLIFVIYLGLVLMSIGVNGFTYYALHGHPYTKMSMWTYMANVLLYLFISSLVFDERVKTFLVKLCCYSASAYALYGILWHLFKPDGRSVHVTFHNSNHYGYYLAVSIALTSAMLVRMMSEKLKEGEKKSDRVIDLVIWTLMMIVQCVALAYNNTLGAWLAVVFSYVFLFIVYRIRDGKFNFYMLIPVAVFFAVSIVGSLFTKSIFTSVLKTVSDVGEIVTGGENANKAGTKRWGLWKATLRQILQRPVFGRGIEGLLAIITKEPGIDTGSPHNEFLEYTAFFGIPAGLAYLAGCLSVFLHGLKYKKELNPITLVCMVGGFAYLVSSCFGVCFYYTVVYPFIFLGLSLNFSEKDRPKEKIPEPLPAEGEELPEGEAVPGTGEGPADGSDEAAEASGEESGTAEADASEAGTEAEENPGKETGEEEPPEVEKESPADEETGEEA